MTIEQFGQVPEISTSPSGAPSPSFAAAQAAVRAVQEKIRESGEITDQEGEALSQINKESLSQMSLEEHQRIAQLLKDLRSTVVSFEALAKGPLLLQIDALEKRVHEFEDEQRSELGNRVSQIRKHSFENPSVQKPSSTPHKVTRGKGFGAIAQFFQRRFGRTRVEQPVEQRGAVEPSVVKQEAEVEFKDLLRSFDIPKKKFGVTGDSLDPKDVPKDFQKMVAMSREWGHRRDEAQKDPVKKLQHEAKFLGVTEVEYKALLLASGKSGSETKKWKQEITNERKIRELLTTLKNNFDEKKVPELLELIKNHPPLGKPEYYAMLYTLLQNVSDQQQRTAIIDAMRISVDAIPSRKLAQFRQEVSIFCPGLSEKALFAPGYTVKTEKQPAITEADESDRHGTIIRFINEDLALLETLEKDPLNRSLIDDVKKKMRSKVAANLLAEKDGIALAKEKLIAARTLQQTWREHPEQALRYYHATSLENYQKILKGKIAVSSMGIAPGAFVSKYPLEQFGTIAFGFGEEIEYHARALTPDVSQDIWLGFDRAVVPDAQTARQGTLFRQTLFKRIMNHPEIKKLPSQQRVTVAMGLAHAFENDLDIRRVSSDKWEAVLILPDGNEITGAAIISALTIPSVFPGNSRRAFRAACADVFQQQDAAFWTFSAIPEAEGEASTTPPDAHMRAFVVFDDDSSLQSKYANAGFSDDGPRKFPSQEEVETTCATLGLKIPVIRWTVARICSDYDVLFGLRQFGEKSTYRPIATKRRFHS